MLSCFSVTMKCACRVGRPGPVFGPLVLYFLACGEGWVSHWSAVEAV